MTWAGKRKLIYISIILAAFIIAALIIIIPHFQVPPTCTDGKQNGAETGVDCGGSCMLYCPGEAKNILVNWSRAFQVVPGVYNAVAYIENRNIQAGIYQVSYEFKFYDEKNLFITSREGVTFIAPNGRSAIFEPNITMNEKRLLKRTTFAFKTNPVFMKVPANFSPVVIKMNSGLPTETDTLPKLEATAENTSIKAVGPIEFIAILYDKDGNAIQASKTYRDAIGGTKKDILYFSWLQPFTTPVAKTEIISRINPFTPLNP